MEATATLDQVRSFSLRAGDILITKDSETANDIGVAAFVPKTLDGVVCGYHVAVLRPKRNRVDPKYLFWSMASAHAREQMSVFASGVTRFGLRFGDVGNLQLCLPDLAIQRSVVGFLDRETARIDDVIKKRVKETDLLRERRQRVISTGVSGGMDGASVARDVLLGRRPQGTPGWPIRRLKHVVARIVDTEHATAADYTDGQYLIVRTTNVRDGALRLEDAKYTDEAGYREWTTRAVPTPGDILLTREAPAGEACIVPEGLPLCIGQRMVLLCVDGAKLDPRYGLYSLYGGPPQEFMKLLSQGSTVEHLNMRDIPNIPLVVPSIEAQRQIVDYLDRRVQQLDRVLEKMEAQIHLLGEHQQTLITAAVTGQIGMLGEVPWAGISGPSGTQ